MATTVERSYIDISGGFTDEKYFQNLKALTFNGALKGIFHVNTTGVNATGLDTAAGYTASITVTGVALGDAVVNVRTNIDVQDVQITGYVQAANTVELIFQYTSGESVDLASATFDFDVLDFT